MLVASGMISRLACLAVAWELCLACSQAQLIPPSDTVPPNFHADTVFADRIRTLTFSSSEPATGKYATGEQFFNQLIAQIPPVPREFSWQLRIAKNAGNILACPDGTIFVDAGMARRLGSNSGLWAAALSHEIVHIYRRDWARRYLYQESLRDAAGGQVVIGSGSASTSWMDPKALSNQFVVFSQKLELTADAEGIMMMARAGFHPAFMPALFEILRGRSLRADSARMDLSHPLWDTRIEKLHPPLVAASKEFDRLWPVHKDSPGGNPPVLAYAGLPSVRNTINGELQVVVPLHCDNLYGSLEVVLRLSDPTANSARELRQHTGCTSKRTLVEFVLPSPGTGANRELMVSVLDDQGSFLTGALLPGPIR